MSYIKLSVFVRTFYFVEEFFNSVYYNFKLRAKEIGFSHIYFILFFPIFFPVFFFNFSIFTISWHKVPSPSFVPSSPTDVLVLAQKQVLEGVLEGGVAEGVAGRVDGAVDVAEPVADGPQRVGDAGGAERGDEHHHVVRRPRGNKSNQDGHDGARHFSLSGRVSSSSPLCHHSLGHCTLCHLKVESSRRNRLLALVYKLH